MEESNPPRCHLVVIGQNVDHIAFAKLSPVDIRQGFIAIDHVMVMMFFLRPSAVATSSTGPGSISVNTRSGGYSFSISPLLVSGEYTANTFFNLR